MDQSFCPNNSTENYPKSISTRNFEAIKSIFTPAMVRHTSLFFSFFNVYVFINNKRTVIAKKIFFFRKYRYLNSLSNATYPIKIHRAVYKKLRFEKKVTKILTSNISEIYGPIMYSAESYPKSTSRRNFKAIKSILLP